VLSIAVRFVSSFQIVQLEMSDIVIGINVGHLT